MLACDKLMGLVAPNQTVANATVDKKPKDAKVLAGIRDPNSTRPWSGAWTRPNPPDGTPATSRCALPSTRLGSARSGLIVATTTTTSQGASVSLWTGAFPSASRRQERRGGRGERGEKHRKEERKPHRRHLNLLVGDTLGSHRPEYFPEGYLDDLTTRGFTNPLVNGTHEVDWETAARFKELRGDKLAAHMASMTDMTTLREK